jgi:hypothetical protein
VAVEGAKRVPADRAEADCVCHVDNGGPTVSLHTCKPSFNISLSTPSGPYPCFRYRSKAWYSFVLGFTRNPWGNDLPNDDDLHEDV